MLGAPLSFIYRHQVRERDGHFTTIGYHNRMRLGINLIQIYLGAKFLCAPTLLLDKIDNKAVGVAATPTKFNQITYFHRAPCGK